MKRIELPKPFFHEKKLCAGCGKEFLAHISYLGNRKYCEDCSTPSARNRRYRMQKKPPKP
jgi:ribosomal protein L37E